MALGTAFLVGFVIAIVVLLLRQLVSEWDAPWMDMLPPYLREKIFKIAYLGHGPKVIERQYRKFGQKPFVLQTPGKQIFVGSSRAHIKELSQASATALSMQSVAKEILQPMHTMQGFDVKDQRGVNGYHFLLAIRKKFTSQLPTTFSRLEKAVSDEFSKELSDCTVVEGKHQVPVFHLAHRLIARANLTACFGADLSSDPELVKAAMQFVMDCFVAGEIIQAGPKCFSLPLAYLVTRRYRACRVLADALVELVERRREVASRDRTAQKPADGLQTMMDACPKDQDWSATQIAHEALAMFFFSVLPLTNTTAFALVDLCSHAEYVTPLRQELTRGWSEFGHHAEGLPLLDSFIKESSRLNGTEWVTGRRKALTPFIFSDGLYVPRGSWIYLPTGSINRDAKLFNDPLQFDGFRFAQEKPSRFTDVSRDWLIWGTGHVICPGRFYASLILKLVLAHTLRNYQCELRDPGKPQTKMWRSGIRPRKDLTILVSAREKQDEDLGLKL